MRVWRRTARVTQTFTWLLLASLSDALLARVTTLHHQFYHVSRSPARTHHHALAVVVVVSHVVVVSRCIIHLCGTRCWHSIVACGCGECGYHIHHNLNDR